MNYFSKIIVCLAVFGTGVIISSHTVSANTSCSQKDLKAIKKFDRKLKKAQENIQDIYQEARRERDPDEIEDTADDIDEAGAIYDSPEYASMKPVYERCGRNIPDINSGFKPFWMPN